MTCGKESDDASACRVRAGTIEALCGGNIATESINATHVGRMAQALERDYRDKDSMAF